MDRNLPEIFSHSAEIPGSKMYKTFRLIQSPASSAQHLKGFRRANPRFACSIYVRISTLPLSGIAQSHNEKGPISRPFSLLYGLPRLAPALLNLSSFNFELSTFNCSCGDPTGIRTPVARSKVWSPGPLDDGVATTVESIRLKVESKKNYEVRASFRSSSFSTDWMSLASIRQITVQSPRARFPSSSLICRCLNASVTQGMHSFAESSA